ncbi:hypothetical protein [Parvicella tangerina]|uniref:Uncharacterized protein n=1 Tax=Parvicella tangerina TaxID=2829795 RepID=A0A916JNF3_9FLAO|nr:hypothetical protein [Parvicella tangerina]CAG5083676.1 hypothetical protein CRYO30217_02261 [Parvicella tangerina]
MKTIYLVVFLFLSFSIFGQTNRFYDKMITRNKLFYRNQVDIWMKAYSYIYEIESWNIKKMKIETFPEEGVELYTKKDYDFFPNMKRIQ